MIHVLLNISSPAMRAGLRSLLSATKTINVLDNTLNEENEADVVVMSASSTHPMDFEPDLPSSAGFLIMSDDQLNVEDLRRSYRAWGVLPMDASADELTAAIHALSQGLIVGTAGLLFESGNEHSESNPLTQREMEVLDLLARGLANKQIATSLGISEHTVKFHVSSIYAKLNVTNRTEAVREGLRGGWIVL